MRDKIIDLIDQIENEKLLKLIYDFTITIMNYYNYEKKSSKKSKK